MQLNEKGDNGAGELVLDRVLSARKQLVAGTLYFLTIQTLDGTNGAQRKFEVAIYGTLPSASHLSSPHPFLAPLELPRPPSVPGFVESLSRR